MEQRELTADELLTLAQRRNGFDAFLDERMPVLTDFVQGLKLPNPEFVLLEAERYVFPIDEWLKEHVMVPSERTWMLTRIGYFVGEYLVQQFHGSWFLNEIVDSKYFGRYVVGNFGMSLQSNAMVDPFVVADAIMSEPTGRSLSELLSRVAQEIVGG